MQVSTNQFYNSANAMMTSLSSQADKLQTQISTGKKLQAPSDDVVAYQQLQTLARAGADDTSYAGTITTAKTLLDQGDTTLSSITAQVQRAQELAIEANNETLSANDRQSISAELRGIVQTLAQLANTQDARGNALFAGTQGGAPVTVNADGTVTINDTGQPAAIPIAKGQSVVATDTANDVFGGIPTASGTTDLFSVLTTLADALDAPGSPVTAASSATDSLKAALDNVANSQASLGARNARLTMVSTAMTDAGVTRETQRSALEDTDVTTAITELQKTMTILQATQASFTKLSSLSLFDYLK
ncbi:MAG: flagellar hook-associated protein FlgL [Sphingomonas sp.]